MTVSEATAHHRARPDVLAVDLDGTLLQSDLLHETFWAAFARDLRTPLQCLYTLRNGRAELKRNLAEQVEIDPTLLPYNPSVLAHIRAWRNDGGHVALVTASDQHLAEGIAAHLGIFDEVHGSTPGRNLKGQAKADFLCDRFGVGRFAYMGDAVADLPIWQCAGQAITVNAPAGLRRRVERLSGPALHLTGPHYGPRVYLRALRPHQWMKNILIFLPLLAGHVFDLSSMLSALLAFAAMSLLASSVYVLNDLLDLAADRAHPRKCRRPLAQGAIPIAYGAAIVLLLLLAGSGLALPLGPSFMAVMGVYLLTTLAYSLRLKRWAVIDICVLAGLYTLRVVAGAAATGIQLSVWLLVFTSFFFLSLATVKRQAELVDNAACGKSETSGRGYQTGDLSIISMISVGSGYVSAVVLSLYIDSPAVVALYTEPRALWGCCAILVYWITRTILLTHRGQMHDDPVVFALRDSVSRLCIAGIAAFILWGAMF